MGCTLFAARYGWTEKVGYGTFLAVQWLRFCASNARGLGSIPGWGTKIPHAARCGQENIKKKKKENVGYTPFVTRVLPNCCQFSRKLQPRMTMAIMRNVPVR